MDLNTLTKMLVVQIYLKWYICVRTKRMRDFKILIDAHQNPVDIESILSKRFIDCKVANYNSNFLYLPYLQIKKIYNRRSLQETLNIDLVLLDICQHAAPVISEPMLPGDSIPYHPASQLHDITKLSQSLLTFYSTEMHHFSWFRKTHSKLHHF